MKLNTIVLSFVIAVSTMVLAQAQPAGAGAAPPAAAKAPATEKAADTKAADPTATYTFVNSSGDLSGVRLSYPVRVYATIFNTTQIVCIPPNFELRALGLLTTAGVPVKLLTNDPNDEVLTKGTCDDKPPSGTTALTPLKDVVGLALIVPEPIHKMFTPRLSGLTYGILVVPFKYYLNGSRDFKGAGTVGPYAGWKLQSSKSASGIELVGFAGLSAVSSEKIVDGKADSETLAAFGYGVAAIGRIRNNFQIGVVLGQDRVGKSSQYKDNGKWWLAMSIGYPFSN